MKKRYKIVLAYDGTHYSGYQLQSNGIAVQQKLEEVLEYLNRAPVRVFGSSRTDAGVHAKGFVAHFDLTKPIPPANLPRAMNSRLPEDIRVLKASYFLYNADILPPCLAPYWAFMHKRLDENAMQKAADKFVGRHDFAPFAANPHRVLETTVRNIFSFEVKRSGPRITFVVRGDGFLYKQVRSMVGFLIRVGLGEEKPEAVTELLDGHVPRTARVPTATGRGLFRWTVFYR